MKSRLVLGASIALLVAAACGDSTGPSGTTGTMSFTMTGGGGGTFNVSGTLPGIAGNIGSNNAAAGARDEVNTQIGVVGTRTRGSGRFDMAVVGISRLSVGTEPIDPNCEPDIDNCSGFVFLVNISQADNDADFICVLEQGTVAITEISDSRVRGTFQGSGECVNDGNPPQFTAFTATNGSFDVPLLSTLPL